MTQTQDAEHFEALGRMDKVKVGEIKGPADFWYAGKGSRKNPMVYPLRVRQENAANNVIRIVQVDNGQVITTVRASSVIWAASLAQDHDARPVPAPNRRRKAAAPVAQDQGEAQALRTVSKEEIRASLAAGEYATPEDADNARKALWSDIPVWEIVVPADVAQVEPDKLPGKPPRNWVDLARTGNTPQARAYWTRACRRYAAYYG